MNFHVMFILHSSKAQVFEKVGRYDLTENV